jgi:hypothetical protein
MLIHGELLQNQGGARLQECGEVPSETKMVSNALEAFGETTVGELCKNLTPSKRRICQIRG